MAALHSLSHPRAMAPDSPRLELTPRAIAIGLLLSVVMGAANVYLGLKAGMTVSASIPAAVVGSLILRSFSRRSSLLEANQIQTAASAGESLAAGIIFTMPALILIGVWQRFDLVTTTLVAFAGGLLGVLFMIPMRRVFVVENETLPYPEGVACAAVLETSDREEGNRDDAVAVAWGLGTGALFKLLISYLGVFRNTLEGAVASAGGRVFAFGADLSPALLAVGFIVRLEVAAQICLGGAIAWLVCIPLFPEINTALGALSPQLAFPIALEGDAGERAWTLWSEGIRYVGVGAMVVGGVASIWQVRGGLREAVTQIRERWQERPGARVATQQTDASAERRDVNDDLSIGLLGALTALAIALIAGIYFRFTGHIGITILSTVVMVVMSFFFVAVASYIVGLVGNSNSPVSGMTITAVLFTGAMLWIFGYEGIEGAVATLGVAAIVCCAACTSGDVCNDLKTGSLVGASPRRQQIMQIAGVAVASLVMAPVLQLLHDAYGIGSRELSAPQATLFANLVRGLFGDHTLPWGLVGLGVLIALLILALNHMLRRAGAHFTLHLMPVAVGIYLPLGLSVPILLGGVMAHIHGRHDRSEVEMEGVRQPGILFASGLIAGESLLGVGIALLVSMGFAARHPAIPMQGALSFCAALLLLAFFFWRSRPVGAN